MNGKDGVQMRGIVFLGEREVALREFPDPVPGVSEVIVDRAN